MNSATAGGVCTLHTSAGWVFLQRPLDSDRGQTPEPEPEPVNEPGPQGTVRVGQWVGQAGQGRQGGFRAHLVGLRVRRTQQRRYQLVLVGGRRPRRAVLTLAARLVKLVLPGGQGTVRQATQTDRQTGTNTSGQADTPRPQDLSHHQNK